MHILDADDDPLVSSSGKKMSRDIVQFVAFNEFNNQPIQLAKEVLQEIPYQFTSYFTQAGIYPNQQVYQVLPEPSHQALYRSNSLELRVGRFKDSFITRQFSNQTPPPPAFRGSLAVSQEGVYKDDLTIKKYCVAVCVMIIVILVMIILF